MDENNTIISKNSSFEGDISADRIVVAGTVVGNLTASSTITIQKNGRIQGNIQAPKVYIAEGGYHDGLICLDNPDQYSPSKVDVGNLISESSDVDIDIESQTEKVPSVSKKKNNKLW